MVCMKGRTEDRTQFPQYSKTALLKIHNTQKSHAEKLQYSETAVLKDRRTRKPQYLKTAELKNRNTQNPQY